MTMRLEFTPEVKAILNEERYDHPMPLVQRRMEALWLIKAMTSLMLKLPASLGFAKIPYEIT
jgi:hypothetical protein